MLMEANEEEGGSFDVDGILEEFYSDREIMDETVPQGGVSYVSEDLRADKSSVIEAVRRTPSVLRQAP